METEKAKEGKERCWNERQNTKPDWKERRGFDRLLTLFNGSYLTYPQLCYMHIWYGPKKA